MSEELKKWIASKFISEIHLEQDYIDALTVFEEQIKDEARHETIKGLITELSDSLHSAWTTEEVIDWLVKKEKELKP